MNKKQCHITESPKVSTESEAPLKSFASGYTWQMGALSAFISAQVFGEFLHYYIPLALRSVADLILQFDIPSKIN